MQGFRILVVESDADRGERLKQFVSSRVTGEVVLVRSGDAAVAAIATAVPDLILTSALLPPPDETRLLSYLKQLDAGSQAPVLVVPPMVDAGQLKTPKPGRLSLFARKSSPWPPYDPDAVGVRIEDALAVSGSARARLIGLVKGNSIDGGKSQPVASPDRSVVRPRGALRRPRARRWAPGELPWVCSAQTRWGLQVRILNISGSGLLIESQTKLVTDASIEFRLSGTATDLLVPARVVRGDVAAVDVRGVKYHAGAVFERRLDILSEGLRPPQPHAASTPRELTELLSRVTAELARGEEVSIVRRLFEHGLHQLVHALDIKIRPEPIAPSDGHESIYFTVPGGGVLQVIFAPNHEPAADDLRLLKAAAAVATVFELHAAPCSQALSLVRKPGQLVSLNDSASQNFW